MHEPTPIKHTPLQEAPLLEAVRPKLYTLAEAANHLGVREDDLVLVIRNTAIALEAQLFFTLAEVQMLEQFIRSARKFYTESVYGGGDL